MRFSITPNSANQDSQQAVAMLLKTLHQANHDRVEFSITSAGEGEGTRLLADVPPTLASLFSANASDLLPNCRVEQSVVDENSKLPSHQSATVRVVPECFSILRDAGDTTNGIRLNAALISALRTGKAGKIITRLSVRLRPSSPQRRREAVKLSRHIAYHVKSAALDRWYHKQVVRRSKLSRFVTALMRHTPLSRRLPLEQDHLKLESHLYECSIVAEVAGPNGASQQINRKLADIVGSLGAFTSDRVKFASSYKAKAPASFKQSCLMTPDEIATIWHPPGADSKVARVKKSAIQEFEPPPSFANRPNHGDTIIGRVVYRNEKSLASLTPDSRMRHAFVVGRTGCGKSTLLKNMIVNDMENGRGVCVLDPHGDLVESLLDYVPKSRTNSVLLFDAGDRDLPVAFNPLATNGHLDPTLVADGVLTAFMKVFGFDAGAAPRMLHIFRNCLLTLVSIRDDSNLISVQRLLTDAAFRKSRISKIDNPAVRQFWLGEFSRWRPADRTQYIASLQNKLGAYLSNPLLAAIFGQTKNKVDFRKLMDEGSIVLLNLSKGRVGTDASSLLGSLFVSTLQTAALSRANIAESERRDFYVYLDEFSTFVSEGNDTFASILAESRKYRTGYTLVTQYAEQLDSQTRSAVFGNCGTMIAMQCGFDDAKVMCSQFAGTIESNQIAHLPRYHAYMTTLADGVPSKPFAIQTLPPPKIKHRRSSIVRKHSQRQYGAVREQVEEEVAELYGA